MTSSAFSSSDVAALERQNECDTDHKVKLEYIWNDSHKRVCSSWIKQNGYKKVCLQFPDDYIVQSVVISDSLKLAVGDDVKVFILADTSYGSCCVDEIAAAHVDADSIIHFGNACRSRISRLPVLYMFPEYDFSIPKFVTHLGKVQENCKNKHCSIFLDIGYHQLIDNKNITEDGDESFEYKLRDVLPAKELQIELFPIPEEINCHLEQSADRICIFIGGDNSRFANLSLTSKAAQWFVYDPSSDTFDEKNPLTSNYIRRRYFYIEKCKDAQKLGLIIATLTSDGYLKIVERIQEMAKKNGIKTQIISVGRINPAKLANFLEIDCFVLIGCPFNNMYTSKEFYKPIVSVFEAEMALNPAWHMKYPEYYVVDFKELLPGGRSFTQFEEGNLKELDISLVSGRIRKTNNEINEVSEADAAALSDQQRAIITQGKMEVMKTNIGLEFEDRTWKGLDQALGCTAPAMLRKGLSGIPINYTHD